MESAKLVFFQKPLILDNKNRLPSEIEAQIYDKLDDETIINLFQASTGLTVDKELQKRCTHIMADRKIASQLKINRALDGVKELRDFQHQLEEQKLDGSEVINQSGMLELEDTLKKQYESEVIRLAREKKVPFATNWIKEGEKPRRLWLIEEKEQFVANIHAELVRITTIFFYKLVMLEQASWISEGMNATKMPICDIQIEKCRNILGRHGLIDVEDEAPIFDAPDNCESIAAQFSQHQEKLLGHKVHGVSPLKLAHS